MGVDAVMAEVAATYRQGSIDALASLLEALETAIGRGLVVNLDGAIALVKVSISFVENQPVWTP